MCKQQAAAGSKRGRTTMSTVGAINSKQRKAAADSRQRQPTHKQQRKAESCIRTTMCTVGALEPVHGAISPPSGVPSGSVNEAVNVTPPLQGGGAAAGCGQQGWGGRACPGNSQAAAADGRLRSLLLRCPFSAARLGSSRQCVHLSSYPSSTVSQNMPLHCPPQKAAPQQHVWAVAGAAKVRHPVHAHTVILVPHLRTRDNRGRMVIRRYG